MPHLTRTRGVTGACLFVIVTSMADPLAQAPTDTVVTGIVEVPRLFGIPGTDDTAAPPGAAASVTLRTRPAVDSPAVAVIRSRAAIESAEHGYEEAGALVYGRDGNWSRLRTSDGTLGWLAPEDGGPFHALEDLLDGALAYLTESWDGTLGETQAAMRQTVPADPRRRIVGYLEPQTRRIQVVLQPGEDREVVRARHAATAMRVRAQPDGTQVLDLEVGTTHVLFERPDRGSAIAGDVVTNQVSRTLATTTSVPERVPVFGRSDGWFEVALRRDRWQESPRVWLKDASAWRFQPIADDADGERFMTRVWGTPSRSVRVVRFDRTGSRLWADVEVLLDSPCEAAGDPVVVARGWMPVHDASGEPAIWFWSRGC